LGMSLRRDGLGWYELVRRSSRRRSRNALSRARDPVDDHVPVGGERRVEAIAISSVRNRDRCARPVDLNRLAHAMDEQERAHPEAESRNDEQERDD